MGSPKTKKFEFPEHMYVVASASVSEKVNILVDASRTDLDITTLTISRVLENVRRLLQPLARHFDREIYTVRGFQDDRIPPRYRKDRVMLVHNGFGQGTFNLAINRNGEWYVDFFDIDVTDKAFSILHSDELASKIFPRLELYVKRITESSSEEWADVLARVGGLSILLKFVGLLRFLTTCLETQQETIKLYRSRLEAMESRIGLLEDYSKALDPLQSSLEEVPLPAYHIYHNHDRGTSNETGWYLSQEALMPFWAIVNNPKHCNRSQYYLQSSSIKIASLKQFVRNLDTVLSEIRNGDGRSVSEVWGRISYRLPFLDSEVPALRICLEHIFEIRSTQIS